MIILHVNVLYCTILINVKHTCTIIIIHIYAEVNWLDILYL